MSHVRDVVLVGGLATSSFWQCPVAALLELRLPVAGRPVLCGDDDDDIARHTGDSGKCHLCG